MRNALPFALAALAAIPCGASAPEARIERNISFLPDHRTEKADLYQPPVPSKPSPAVLVIHGGGWVAGRKDSRREAALASTLALHGFTALCIDYKLGTADGSDRCWPQNLHDCKTAVRWLRAHSKPLNIDPDNIGAIGLSSGGHLACLVGFTGAEDGLEPGETHEDESSAVKCIVDFYGPIDTSKHDDIGVLGKTRQEAPWMYRQFSPLSHLDKNDPPVLIFHGTQDEVVEVQHARTLAEALARFGVEHQLEIIEGAGHGFGIDPPQRNLLPTLLDFLNRHLRTTQ